MEMTGPEDAPVEELMRASHAGDAVALQALLARHLPDLRAFVRIRMSPALRTNESESDLVQSVCREILTHPDRFDFQGDHQFRNWLFGAVLQKVQAKERYWRAGKRAANRKAVLPDSYADLATTYAPFRSPSQAAIAAEEVQRVEAAFDLLSPEQREILTLHRFVGLPHGEIAARLGKTEGAVRMALHRGLARLASILEEPADEA